MTPQEILLAMSLNFISLFLVNQHFKLLLLESLLKNVMSSCSSLYKILHVKKLFKFVDNTATISKAFNT